jgi:Fic family protein
MPWNWELPEWPNFHYKSELLAQKERQFLLRAGSTFAYLKNINEQEYNKFVVEILSTEGMESSRIEGEFLDRESLQSSIKQHFGLKTAQKTDSKKEAGMAILLCNVYEHFDKPLTHEMLWLWHSRLFEKYSHIEDCGKYRTHSEPMLIVSNRLNSSRIYFEAPPSSKIADEMEKFVHWFNSISQNESILARAALAHVYFESIHPFEDGNGRIGRVLVEKILSQGVGRPILMAVSKILEKRKKEYYAALERCNKTLEVGHWVDFFTDVILQAQEESLNLLYFLIEKSKMLTNFSSQLNPRQEKVLLRMFAEGLEGFKGGLSAENYLAITKTSRATATRDLTDLVNIGVFVKKGVLRNTRYYLNLKPEDIF